MKREYAICICAATVAFALKLFAADASICVDTGKARFPVAPDLWGIFFEDINLSLGGGVYAEMVRNRSFEDCNGNERDMTLEYWHPVGSAEITLDSSLPISRKNNYAVRVAGPSEDAHNSPFAPDALKETVAPFFLDGTPLELPPLSLTIYKIQE